MKSIAKANGRNTALTSASHINEAHRLAIETAAKAMFAGIERAIEVGRLLAEEKAKHQHGEWIPWIENNLEFNRVQAAGYLRAYDKRDQLSNVQPGNTFDGGLKGALKLLSKPRPKKKESGERGARARQDAALAQIVSEQTDEETETDIVDEVDPENYRTAFVLRASQALQFASDCAKLSRNTDASDDLIAWARRVVDAWKNTVEEMEKRQ